MKRALWLALTLGVLCFTGLAMAQGVDPILDSGAVAVPPEWLVTLLNFIGSMPVVGPYVAIALQWLGVLVAILTTITASLVAIMKALQKVLPLVKLAHWVGLVEAFEKGPIMHWLKSLSAFFNEPKKK